MRRHFMLAVIGTLSLIPSAVLATERTVTLAVQNMSCSACPFTVRSSLQAVTGVKTVSVSLKTETATVTYDDAKTDIRALTSATTNAGYPSTLKN